MKVSWLLCMCLFSQKLYYSKYSTLFLLARFLGNQMRFWSLLFFIGQIFLSSCFFLEIHLLLSVVWIWHTYASSIYFSLFIYLHLFCLASTGFLRFAIWHYLEGVLSHNCFHDSLDDVFALSSSPVPVRHMLLLLARHHDSWLSCPKFLGFLCSASL